MKATYAQRQYLLAIRDLSRELGYPPSFVELGARLGGVTKSGIADMVARLERHGLVSKGVRTARSILLTKAGEAALR